MTVVTAIPTNELVYKVSVTKYAVNITDAKVTLIINGTLTYCGPMTPYDDTDLGQQWLR